MIRIIGLGSPFGDDQVGWRVIELLRGRLAPEIELFTLDRPGAALVNWMYDVDWLILVDAVESTGAAGHVVTVDPTRVSDGAAFTSHSMRLPETLRLARTLGCLPARVDIRGITIGDVRAEALSAQAAAAAARLAASLKRELR